MSDQIEATADEMLALLLRGAATSIITNLRESGALDGRLSVEAKGIVESDTPWPDGFRSFSVSALQGEGPNQLRAGLRMLIAVHDRLSKIDGAQRTSIAELVTMALVGGQASGTPTYGQFEQLISTYQSAQQSERARASAEVRAWWHLPARELCWAAFQADPEIEAAALGRRIQRLLRNRFANGEPISRRPLPEAEATYRNVAANFLTQFRSGSAVP